LAAGQSVINAFRRVYDQKQEFNLQLQDFVWYGQQVVNVRDICIVLDTSNSMGTNRFHEVARLINRIIHTATGYFSLIIFQGNGAKTAVAWTRNKKTVQKCLQLLRPGGLTPLGTGLMRAISYCKGRERKVVLLVISDGLPTAPLSCPGPFGMAYDAALKLKKMHFKTVFVGLESNEKFLRDLAKCAGGDVVLAESWHAEKITSRVKRIIKSV
jgi:Mg-chelatase subunit ChlD